MKDEKKQEQFSQENIERCISILEELLLDNEKLSRLPEQQRIDLLRAAGRLSRPDRNEIRKRNREVERSKRRNIVQQERQARAATGIRTAREAEVFSVPKRIAGGAPRNGDQPRRLHSPRNCYICKAEFTDLHFFYDSMCPKCAEFNYEKRFQTAPLDGRVALITGARLKIGYQTALKMLRAGAAVIATTRFPVDAALRYSKEEDFSSWKDRLQIYGLDLRHIPSVEIFTRLIAEKYGRLDILTNNAAQTVRRPPGFYVHLMENELKGPSGLPVPVQSLLEGYRGCLERLDAVSAPIVREGEVLPVSWNGKAPGIGLRASAQLSQVPYAYDNSIAEKEVFPLFDSSTS